MMFGCRGAERLQASNTAKTKRPNVTVNCMAAYNSEIDAPADMGIEDAIRYAKEHLDDIPLGEIEYVMDSDELDEDNCDF
ncbi:MAG TPA: hypothetical protein PLN48_02470 [Lachnospiraceae bacterium]|nr:hypothetical protein [Lachnospiraceae bacterium]